MTEDDCSIIICEALKQRRFTLLINEARRVCKTHQISTPKSEVASSADEAVEKAAEIGYPVVLKIVSPEIVHKTDFGGVILDVRNEKDLRIQFEKLLSNIKGREPTAAIQGVLVEKMMPASTEVIIGGIKDSQFGPSVMFGMGGIFAEVYNDVTFRVAPIDRIDALNMIQGLKGSIIFQGIRGKPALDIDGLVGAMIIVSEIMCQHNRISQLDLNPVIVYSKGVCAVDSRIILSEGGA